jgi:hypothetical protein
MKYFYIEDKHQAVEYFNEVLNSLNLGGSYRVIESEESQNIISNVPPEIYANSKLAEYTPPSSNNIGNNNKFISFLHDGFNFFHNNHPDAHLRYEDGKLFHHNNCYDNSVAVYFCLLNLSKSICVGYVSKSLQPGGLLGNAVINMKNLVVHDWHIWNMVNDFIIDLSISNTGGVYGLSAKNIIWDKSENYVFKYPPSNISYRGINFTSLEKFKKFTMELFPQQEKYK